MQTRVFTSEGCIRCTIVKHYLADKGIAFEEHDIKTEAGNAAFKAFYRDHRPRVRRDAGGIFFPVVAMGEDVLQDAGPTLAWLEGGAALTALITPNNLGHGWTGGLRVDACDAPLADAFVAVVRRLKAGGLRTEAQTAGGNAALLRSLLEEQLLDRCVFYVHCADTAVFTGEVDSLPPDWAGSVAAACAAAGQVDVRFRLEVGLAACPPQDAPSPPNTSQDVGPAPCTPQGTPQDAPQDAAPAPCTPQDAARAAQALHSIGGNRLPCCVADSAGTAGNLFPYRTAVRRWQVLADICA